MKDTLLHVLLEPRAPMQPPPPSEHARLLQSIIGFRDRRVLAFGARGTSKHENMGRIAAEIAPRPDGTFTVEVGVILHDLLPTPGTQQEYSLNVPGEVKEDSKELHFSNQLLRVRYLRNNEPYHLLCPFYRLNEVQAGETDAPVDAPFEFLNTFVTASYDMSGVDADDALSSHLEAALISFIGRINRVVAAHLLVATEQTGLLTPSYDRGSFEHVYLLIGGVQSDVVRPERLGMSLFRNSLVTAEYDIADSERFRAYVAGTREVDDVARLLRSARGYIEGGVLHLALLQLAIAAELATTRYVHAEYVRRGVSKRKLDDRKAEITFGLMLNIEVAALAPPGKRPDDNLVGKIDRIRHLRNDLMHYGHYRSSQDELRELHEATKKYTVTLASLATSVSPEGVA